MRTYLRIFAVLMPALACASLAFPQVAAAQEEEELEFDLEEVQEGTGEEDATGADDELEFGLDEVEAPTVSVGPPISGFVVPAEEGVDPQWVETLSDALSTELSKLPGYSAYPNIELKEKFEGLDAEASADCLYNPICLAKMGREVQLKYVLIGRVSGTEGNWSIAIDLINVDNNSVQDYSSKIVKGGLPKVQKAMGESLYKLFKINRGQRKVRKETPQAEASALQKTLAYSALGVAAVTFGAGIYFGIDAGSQESSVKADAEAGKISQTKAESLVTDAKGAALMANVFYGLSLAAGLAGGLLMVITPGQDIASEEELNSFNISPVIAPDGTTGFTAGFTW